MKTTEDIVNDAKHFECNNLRNYDFKKDFMRFYNQKWYSEEEMQEIKYQRDLFTDNVIILNKLFGDEK